MNRLLFRFVLQFFIKKVRQLHGVQASRLIKEQSLHEYNTLLPLVPEVGGIKNYFSAIVVANGWFIATFKGMKSAGLTAEDSMKAWAELASDLFSRIPVRLRALLGRLLTSDKAIKGFQRQAENSQLRSYPDDWVYRINTVEGIDLAMEFDECAAIKMYRAMGAEDLAPYCSFGDVTYSAYLGIGLDATETLGLGFQTCKLYFRRQGNVNYNRRLNSILPAHLSHDPGTVSIDKTACPPPGSG